MGHYHPAHGTWREYVAPYLVAFGTSFLLIRMFRPFEDVALVAALLFAFPVTLYVVYLSRRLRRDVLDDGA